MISSNLTNIILKTLGILCIILLSSCLKDSSIEEQLSEEQQLIEEYLEDNNITTEPTSSGLYFIEHDTGTGGNTPGADDFIVIEFTGKFLDQERIYETTYEQIAIEEDIYSENFLYGPYRTSMNSLVFAGLREGVSMMHKGGKATLIIPSYLASYHYDHIIRTRIYDIKLNEIITDIEEYENNQLIEYLKGLNYHETIDTSTDTSVKDEIIYIETVRGSGEYATIGDQVDIAFVEKLLDGRVIDSVPSSDPYTIQLFESKIIEGLIDGISMMNEGDQGIIIIPHQLAYGENRVKKIPPYSTLVFEIELIKIH